MSAFVFRSPWIHSTPAPGNRLSACAGCRVKPRTLNPMSSSSRHTYRPMPPVAPSTSTTSPCAAATSSGASTHSRGSATPAAALRRSSRRALSCPLAVLPRATRMHECSSSRRTQGTCAASRLGHTACTELRPPGQQILRSRACPLTPTEVREKAVPKWPVASRHTPEAAANPTTKHAKTQIRGPTARLFGTCGRPSLDTVTEAGNGERRLLFRFHQSAN